MNYILNKIKTAGLSLLALAILCASCNKANVNPVPLPVPANSGANTLAKTLAASASDSLYNRLVIRSGILTAIPATITDSTQRFTMFVPDNNAMKVFINGLSGGAVPLTAPDAVFSGFITANIPVANAVAIVEYNIIPQEITTSSFPTSFPNLQYPTILNPAPTLSALLRLTTFLSKRGTFDWVNNIPLSSADAMASNGVIHHVPAIVLPPMTSLWGRISTDPDMTYFKAAVLRADSGTFAPPATAGTLQSALDNIGANLTVLVPTDSAMRALLTGEITLALIAEGVPPGNAASTAGVLAYTPAVFTNFTLYSVLTARVVQGIIVYHILGTRAFTVNLPATAANFPTLLNGVIPAHPGVTLQATFSGPIVIAATVKGVGNATASKFLLDPTPYTGKSDQNATNGVLHKIDQVLLPQ